MAFYKYQLCSYSLIHQVFIECHYWPSVPLVLKIEQWTKGTNIPALMKIIFWLEIQTLNNITRKVIASLNTKGEKARKEINVTEKNTWEINPEKEEQVQMPWGHEELNVFEGKKGPGGSLVRMAF